MSDNAVMHCPRCSVALSLNPAKPFCGCPEELASAVTPDPEREDKPPPVADGQDALFSIPEITAG